MVDAGLVPGVPVFDLFPYGLGGALLSLEGVLLASFVFLKRAHEGHLPERQPHLKCQANLSVESAHQRYGQSHRRPDCTRPSGNATPAGCKGRRTIVQVTIMPHSSKAAASAKLSV